MRSFDLQLILPKRLHATFKPKQQAWLMDLTDFLALAQARQGA